MSEVLTPELVLRGAILIVPVLVLLVLLSHWKAKRAAVRSKVSGVPASTGDQGKIEQLLKMPFGEALTAADNDHMAALEARLSDAEASGERHATAALYLELAEQRHARGEAKEAMVALRSAAGISAKNGPCSVHAAARMALAEAAFNAGDLTSACEQWQLARAAFQTDGAVAQADAIDARMRSNGCPTDWVLTDF